MLGIIYRIAAHVALWALHWLYGVGCIEAGLCDAIKRRLDRLKTADMPWLTTAGLASIKDAPEQSGPREYVKPKGWK